MKLSILDQSPLIGDATPAEALKQTVELAKQAEKWGYHRFWVSEHHFSNRLAGSSPEVLLGHLSAVTSHIRIGSGGVMLPHYSAYKVAENFRGSRSAGSRQNRSWDWTCPWWYAHFFHCPSSW
ncbi:hypothetical protein BsIDN1_67000 [Bacillus safensis]|uniref:Luciferase-like domain-containing protein n=1 Tax=Bacillus safensis TaxID=561879 RepID=A0A5S9MK83_BACIA|nr:hypothetical protein BsIDN1_67000 [Bacillus safensis]